SRDLAGIVLNAAIRDFAAIHRDNFPVYASGVTHRGPYKDGPGEINVPISLNGMIIEPGDLVLGDEDGILCIPLASAEDIYRRSKEKHELEEIQMHEIYAGTFDRSWVDETLIKNGCNI